MSIHDNPERPDRLHALDKAREELLQEFNRALPPHWNIDLGRFHIPIRLASTGLSWLYVALDVAAFAFGIACIFLGQSWRELGVALIVGAMFGISTFVGQLLGTQLSVRNTGSTSYVLQSRFYVEYLLCGRFVTGSGSAGRRVLHRV
jgi:hypothetical protein